MHYLNNSVTERLSVGGGHLISSFQTYNQNYVQIGDLIHVLST
jgi:hypothetical protein